jgi:hypothetical protein
MTGTKKPVNNRSNEAWNNAKKIQWPELNDRGWPEGTGNREICTEGEQEKRTRSTYHYRARWTVKSNIVATCDEEWRATSWQCWIGQKDSINSTQIDVVWANVFSFDIGNYNNVFDLSIKTATIPSIPSRQQLKVAGMQHALRRSLANLVTCYYYSSSVWVTRMANQITSARYYNYLYEISWLHKKMTCVLLASNFLPNTFSRYTLLAGNWRVFRIPLQLQQQLRLQPATFYIISGLTYKRNKPAIERNVRWWC